VVAGAAVVGASVAGAAVVATAVDGAAVLDELGLSSPHDAATNPSVATAASTYL
jgi:hypothetical protein